MLKTVPVLPAWALVFALSAVPTPAPAQSTGAFSASDAILDTAIPFAIGAHEAEQQLRSSFGWSTFQEGLVDGVYYRFDPDGYARFAPTPRLDEDSFEVMCSAVTLLCAARKETMDMELTPQGRIKLALRGLHPDDIFFLVDDEGELPLPSRITEPLDARFEALLSSGGDLVIRRQGEMKQRISLTGFGAVASYLKWVASEQDYAVLPVDWPVPNPRRKVAGQLTSFDRLADHGRDIVPEANTWETLQAQRSVSETLEPVMETSADEDMAEMMSDAGEPAERPETMPPVAMANEAMPVVQDSAAVQETALRVAFLEDHLRSLRSEMREMQQSLIETRAELHQNMQMPQVASDFTVFERLETRLMRLEDLLAKPETMAVAPVPEDQPDGTSSVLANRWPDLAVTSPNTEAGSVEPEPNAPTAMEETLVGDPAPRNALTMDAILAAFDERMEAMLALQSAPQEDEMPAAINDPEPAQTSEIRLKRGLVEDILAELDRPPTPIAPVEPAAEPEVQLEPQSTQPEEIAAEDEEFMLLNDYVARILDREASKRRAMLPSEGMQ